MPFYFFIGCTIGLGAVGFGAVGLGAVGVGCEVVDFCIKLSNSLPKPAAEAAIESVNVKIKKICFIS